MTQLSTKDGEPVYDCDEATVEQRAEAFLRVKGIIVPKYSAEDINRARQRMVDLLPHGDEGAVFTDDQVRQFIEVQQELKARGWPSHL